MDRVLCQFPISHYCEKVRWVLDYKRLPYRIHNQLPGPHAFTNRARTGKTTVPVLLEDGKAIGGSHTIAMHLEACDGARPLVPAAPASRAVLEDTVRYFDRIVGPAVRRYAYGFITARPEMFREMFFAEYRGRARAIGMVIATPIRHVIARMYDVHSPSAKALPDVIRAAADRVERQLQGGGRYLLDDRFSLADVTVGSLLGPMIGAAGSPWEQDIDVPELRELRAELRARPVGVYVEGLYAERHSPAIGPETRA